jgi:beta-N-acetylhexosaminidase
MIFPNDVTRQLGRLFMVGLPGHELDVSTRGLIAEAGINNFIIFKRNVANPEQLRALCSDLVGACREQGLAAPLIAIDQEGGTVARLPPPFTQFAGAREMADSEQPEQRLIDFARCCARELREVGISMNLAPVLDVSPLGQGLFMEKRALGGDPVVVARLGRLVINTLQEEGVAACAKHFPGLGAAVLDPHLKLPRVELSRAQMLASDILPFRVAVATGVAAFMTSHTIYNALDPDRIATLSPAILTGLLREDLCFDGLVITDDLEMGAIENALPVSEAALASFAAGVDLLLICHGHDKVRRAHARLLAAVADGFISRERLAQSLRRIAEVVDRFVIRAGC